MRALKIVGLTLLVTVIAGPFQGVVLRAQRTPDADHRQLAGQEILIVEDVISARNKYKEGLEKLIAFYTLTRNDLKLKKAQAELTSLKAVSQYSYVIVAESLGPNIRPVKSIPEAEKLYTEARRHDTAPPSAHTDEDKRKALNAYLSVITRYPESTRVAECAYYIGVIYETRLRDYHRAVVYYEKAFQWDPVTAHPTRIKAARLCYYFLKDRKRAKTFYQTAMEKSPSAAYRAEATAMFNSLKAQGY